ncbi:riboflavin biosynthesis protein RibF [Luminiphilus syltensis NOR5-1B]|uniref:Riboflavin biosynthesis protein n=1 Tax=Luminiphilus syltensis NOR5-1B TaxID=565045 RepID=B8KX10_9GAMM|nr:bifunctional riboflavin kinase/FAD synthetase [Luminiphilus syltensis]EED34762.1 riboflavin biosynthesis protein RibF [Luminiphilus syltensis NOR5-1B]
MEIIRGLHNLRPRHRGCAATVGAFDGVHLGHRAVLEHLKSEAARLGVASTVIFFEPLPREYFQPLEAPARLMNFREKCVALRDVGIDQALCLRFDERVRNMSADGFIEAVFSRGLEAQYIAIGDDFRFGKSREGDLRYMAERAQEYGYEVRSTSTLARSGERVSSTRIRAALAEGDFQLAAELLGRRFVMGGRVLHGKQLGRQLGFPTANIALHRLRAPVQGVFVVSVTGEGLDSVPALANVGVRPTVEDSIRANLEVHLIDVDEDLYGRRLTVNFLHKLRDENKFEGIEALRAAISNDLEQARQWLATYHGWGRGFR